MPEFDFVNKFKLAVEPLKGGEFKFILLDPTRKPMPIGVLEGAFWLRWASSQKVAKLAKKTGVSEEQVREALDKIGGEIELRGPRALGLVQAASADKADENTEMRPEIKKKALELLRSPDLLYKIKSALDRGFIIDRYRAVLDEDNAKLLTYLIAFSAKTSWPQAEWVTADAGLGKTNLVMATLWLFPSNYYKKRAYITAGALRHGESSYNVLFLQEFRQGIEQDVRLFSKEDGGYAFEVAVKDPETGEWTTEVKEIPAKTLITTSAENLPSPQLLRRVWLVSLNDSAALTRKINERKGAFRAGEHQPVDAETLEVFRAAVEILEPQQVVIPFAKELTDLAPWDRTTLDNLYDMISVVANLHQLQRETDSNGRIIASLADLYSAVRICWPFLTQTIAKLPDRLAKCLSKLKELGEATSKELARALKLGQSTVRGYLSDLVNLGYVYEDREFVDERGEKRTGRVVHYSPSELSVEVLNTVDDLLKSEKWLKVVDFAKRSNIKGVLASVESKGGEDKTHVCLDPLTGRYVCLFTSGKSSTLGEEGSKTPETAKEGEKSDIPIFNTNSTASTVQHLKEDIPAESGAPTRFLCRFVTDVPHKVVGSDGRVYGPFKAGDVAELPNENAELMVKRGGARPWGLEVKKDV